MFTNKSTVASIQKKSAAIKDIFTKTKDDCIALNQEINTLQTQKFEEIAKLQEEVNQLDTTKKGNEKLVAKIDSFLND